MYRKSLSVLITCVYFLGNVALCHAAETNVWKERRDAAKSIQLARLPAMDVPIRTTPLSSMSVRQNTLPSKPNTPTVYLIQDVHANAEAQTNIAAAIKEIAANQKTSLVVGVEGANGPFDFAPYRQFGNKKVAQAVANQFLKENKISAVGYAGLTQDEPLPTFVGVDDETHYEANIEAYRTAVKDAPALKAANKQEAATLAAKKSTVLNADLKTLDAAQTAYRAGTMPLGKYLQMLSTYAPDNDKHIDSFLEALRLEELLNFPTIERERRTVLEKLLPRLSKMESDRLWAESLSFRNGTLSHADYYRRLEAALNAHAISLHATPAFATYLRYIQLAERIDADNLLAALETLEEKTISTLTRTNEEKTLMADGARIYLTGKLLNFALTPKEWEKYQKVLSSSVRQFSELKPFEDFYREADIRSEKMAKNLLDVSLRTNSLRTENFFALVAGGFHTALIAADLKKRGLNVAIVTPKLTKVDSGSGSAYLSAFTREKTPLEKLLEGDKLFLADSRTLVGSRAPRAAATAALAFLAISAFSSANAAVQHIEVPNKPQPVAVAIADNFDHKKFDEIATQPIESLGTLRVLRERPSIKESAKTRWAAFLAIIAMVFPHRKKSKEEPAADPIEDRLKVLEDLASTTQQIEDAAADLQNRFIEKITIAHLQRILVVIQIRTLEPGIQQLFARLFYRYTIAIKEDANIRKAINFAGMPFEDAQARDTWNRFLDDQKLTPAPKIFRIPRAEQAADDLEAIAKKLADQVFYEDNRKRAYTILLQDPSALSDNAVRNIAIAFGTFQITGNEIQTEFAKILRARQHVLGTEERSALYTFMTSGRRKSASARGDLITILDTPLQSWSGTFGGVFVYGFLMPLVEEAIRLHVHDQSALLALLIYPIVHAGLHFFIDVKEAGFKGYRDRLPTRMTLSFIFATAYLIGWGLASLFTTPETARLIGWMTASAVHILNNTWFRNKVTSMGFYWPVMAWTGNAAEKIEKNVRIVEAPDSSLDEISNALQTLFDDKSRQLGLSDLKRLVTVARTRPLDAQAQYWMMSLLWLSVASLRASAEFKEFLATGNLPFSDPDALKRWKHLLNDLDIRRQPTAVEMQTENNPDVLEVLAEKLANGLLFTDAKDDACLRLIIHKDLLTDKTISFIASALGSSEIKSYRHQDALADILRTRVSALTPDDIISISTFLRTTKRTRGSKAVIFLRQIIETQPQSWTGTLGGPWVYGFVMPLAEELGRLAAIYNGGIVGAFIYAGVHAFVHFYVDIYAARGDGLTWKEFLTRRVWIRFAYSLAFTLPYLAPFLADPTQQNSWMQKAFALAFELHAHNNTWVYDFLTKKLGWKWLRMSAVPAASDYTAIFSRPWMSRYFYEARDVNRLTAPELTEIFSPALDTMVAHDPSTDVEKTVQRILETSLEPSKTATSFFRWGKEWGLEEFLQTIIPMKWEGNRRIYVRHVSGSSGNEAYSAAILIREALETFHKKIESKEPFEEWLTKWDIRLDSFDSNLIPLSHVKKGVSPKRYWTHDNASKELPFVEEGSKQITISPLIHSWVHPIYLDLTDDRQLELLNERVYDVTFSLTTLMYLPDNNKRHVLDALLSPSEATTPALLILRPHVFPGLASITRQTDGTWALLNPANLKATYDAADTSLFLHMRSLALLPGIAHIEGDETFLSTALKSDDEGTRENAEWSKRQIQREVSRSAQNRRTFIRSGLAGGIAAVMGWLGAPKKTMAGFTFNAPDFAPEEMERLNRIAPLIFDHLDEKDAELLLQKEPVVRVIKRDPVEMGEELKDTYELPFGKEIHSITLIAEFQDGKVEYTIAIHPEAWADDVHLLVDFNHEIQMLLAHLKPELKSRYDDSSQNLVEVERGEEAIRILRRITNNQDFRKASPEAVQEIEEIYIPQTERYLESWRSGKQVPQIFRKETAKKDAPQIEKEEKSFSWLWILSGIGIIAAIAAIIYRRMSMPEQKPPQKKKKPQSWTGTLGGPWMYGFVMPLIEELARLTAIYNGGILGAFIYAGIHAFIHFYLDIYAARGDGLTWKQFLTRRVWIRFTYSLAFTLPYIFPFIGTPSEQNSLMTHAFLLASDLHIGNNTWLYEFMTETLGLKWLRMSAAPAAWDYTETFSQPWVKETLGDIPTFLELPPQELNGLFSPALDAIRSSNEDIDVRKETEQILRNSKESSIDATEFFRGTTNWGWESFLGELIPQKWNGTRRIRVRHVAGSSGEEATSAAILLYEALQRFHRHINSQEPFEEWLKHWDIRFDSFDRNIIPLSHAKKNIVRDPEKPGEVAPQYTRKASNYLRRVDNHLEVLEPIRSWVRPVYLDLRDPRQLSVLTSDNYDATFSVTTLTYLSDTDKRRVLDALNTPPQQTPTLFVCRIGARPPFISVTRYPDGKWDLLDDKGLRSAMKPSAQGTPAEITALLLAFAPIQGSNEFLDTLGLNMNAKWAKERIAEMRRHQEGVIGHSQPSVKLIPFVHQTREDMERHIGELDEEKIKADKAGKPLAVLLDCVGPEFDFIQRMLMGESTFDEVFKEISQDPKLREQYQEFYDTHIKRLREQVSSIAAGSINSGFLEIIKDRFEYPIYQWSIRTRTPIIPEEGSFETWLNFQNATGLAEHAQGIILRGLNKNEDRTEYEQLMLAYQEASAKSHREREELVAQQVRRLIDEGYAVVVMMGPSHVGMHQRLQNVGVSVEAGTTGFDQSIYELEPAYNVIHRLSLGQEVPLQERLDGAYRESIKQVLMNLAIGLNRRDSWATITNVVNTLSAITPSNLGLILVSFAASRVLSATSPFKSALGTILAIQGHPRLREIVDYFALDKDDRTAAGVIPFPGWQRFINYLQNLRVTRGWGWLTDRAILGVIGFTEELIISGVLVSGGSALAKWAFGLQESPIGIVSIIVGALFLAGHTLGDLYKLKDGKLTRAPPTRKDFAGLLGLTLVTRIGYWASQQIDISSLIYVIPVFITALLVVSLLHGAGFNFGMTKYGFASGLVPTPGTPYYEDIAKKKLFGYGINEWLAAHSTPGDPTERDRTAAELERDTFFWDGLKDSENASDFPLYLIRYCVQKDIRLETKSLHAFLISLKSHLSEDRKRFIPSISLPIISFIQVRMALSHPRVQEFLQGKAFKAMDAEDRLGEIVALWDRLGLEVDADNLGHIHAALPATLAPGVTKKMIHKVDFPHTVFNQVRNAIDDIRVQEFLKGQIFQTMDAENRLSELVVLWDELGLKVDSDNLGAIYSALPATLAAGVTKKMIHKVMFPRTTFNQVREAIRDDRVQTFLRGEAFEAMDPENRLAELVAYWDQLNIKVDSENLGHIHGALPATLAPGIFKNTIKKINLSRTALTQIREAIRDERVQAFLKGNAFKEMDAEDRLGELVAYWDELGLKVAANNLAAIHSALPATLAPGVTNKMIQVANFPRSIFIQVRLLVEHEKIKPSLDKFSLTVKSNIAIAKKLIELVKLNGLQLNTSNLEQIATALPKRLKARNKQDGSSPGGSTTAPFLALLAISSNVSSWKEIVIGGIIFALYAYSLIRQYRRQKAVARWNALLSERESSLGIGVFSFERAARIVKPDHVVIVPAATTAAAIASEIRIAEEALPFTEEGVRPEICVLLTGKREALADQLLGYEIVLQSSLHDRGNVETALFASSRGQKLLLALPDGTSISSRVLSDIDAISAKDGYNVSLFYIQKLLKDAPGIVGSIHNVLEHLRASKRLLTDA